MIAWSLVKSKDESPGCQMLSGFYLKSVTATSCDNHVMLLENPSFEGPACFLFKTVFVDRADRDFYCAWFTCN